MIHTPSTRLVTLKSPKGLAVKLLFAIQQCKTFARGSGRETEQIRLESSSGSYWSIEQILVQIVYNDSRTLVQSSEATTLPYTCHQRDRVLVSCSRSAGRDVVLLFALKPGSQCVQGCLAHASTMGLPWKNFRNGQATKCQFVGREGVCAFVRQEK
jgi:hypothetical protein